MKTDKPSGNGSPQGRPPARRDESADERTRVRQLPQEKTAGKAGGKKGRINRGVVVRTVLLNMLKAGVALLCVAAIVGSLVAVQMVQYVVEATENDDTLLNLETYVMAQTSYIMILNPDNPNAKEENDWIEYQELVGDEDRIYVPLDEIPQNLINAVVATEDREFWDHGGVNIRRTVAALVNDIVPLPGMRGGASTIDQQLVKNITKEDTVAGSDGYKRKLREIFRAWGLENRYSKEMILEAYLNTIGLSERIAGVGAGALRYFNKEVKDLTLAECAVIAGITQAPTRYSPIQNPENSLNRRDTVLAFMEDCGYITEEEMLAAQAEPLGLAPREEVAQQSASSGVFSYISDKVYNDVINDLMEQNGMNYQAAKNLVYNGGLRIYATADLRVQNALDGIMVTGYNEDGFFLDGTRFPGYERALTITEEITNSAGNVIGTQEVMPQCAVVVISYDGELIATSGGIGEKEASLSLNRSMGTVLYDSEGEPYVQGTVRQVGSTMKPIAAYALGIDYGIINYSKMVMDAAVQSRDPYNPRRDPETGAIVKDWPSNFGVTRNERIPIFSAIAESTNTVAAQVGIWVGREQMFEFLVDTLQITSLDPTHDVDLGPLVLGSQHFGMSAYELAGAYQMFGGTTSYGRFNTLHSYHRVEDAQGNTVLEPELTPMQAISEQSGYVMNRMLANVLRRGSYLGGASATAGGMVPSHPEGEMDAVAKTGTTSDDNDRWFVGLTPYYITAVWWGYDQDHTLRGRWSPAASTNIPVNVWKALMEDVQAEMPIIDFPEMPAGVSVESFCTSSGDLWQPGCPGSQQGYYTETGMPNPCVGHEGEVVEEAPAA